MCGIFGVFNKDGNTAVFDSSLLQHRGPDSFGSFSSDCGLYMAHYRLTIIGLDLSSDQPIQGRDGSVIVTNGEIYNYQDLKKSVLSNYPFKTTSDTEVILALYEKYGVDCVHYLRGMFAFAIWDSRKQQLFCARDRFGMKPYYFTDSKERFAFASEIKALLPFLKVIGTHRQALSEYLTFQYTLGSETLFRGMYQLMPGHYLVLKNFNITIKRYWDIVYRVDYSHSSRYFEEKLFDLLQTSVRMHKLSDVPIASYLSGGLDSSLIAALSAKESSNFYGCFHGRFTDYPGYDESEYAQTVARMINRRLFIKNITAQDFVDNIQKVIYHLDVPVAGPGSFPQFMLARLASQHVKVVLGGQGGDEMFGGYARYILAYFEQAIKAAIDGSYRKGHFLVTPESIIPNLSVLQGYQPLMQEFWKEGMFESLDKRYFRLIDRSSEVVDEIDWNQLDRSAVLARFLDIFNNHNNVSKECYFDKMTHFDFKCLLPALLHVEDRVSMAHGLESRVPFLDHKLVEFAATVPADVKFPGGKMKAFLKTVFKNYIPAKVVNRQDKMGFPVPLKEWFEGSLKDFVHDIFSSQCAKTRGFYDSEKVLRSLSRSRYFSRKVWGLLSLELWYREFHDKSYEYTHRSVNQKERVI